MRGTGASRPGDQRLVAAAVRLATHAGSIPACGLAGDTPPEPSLPAVFSCPAQAGLASEVTVAPIVSYTFWSVKGAMVTQVPAASDPVGSKLLPPGGPPMSTKPVSPFGVATVPLPARVRVSLPVPNCM